MTRYRLALPCLALVLSACGDDSSADGTSSAGASTSSSAPATDDGEDTTASSEADDTGASASASGSTDTDDGDSSDTGDEPPGVQREPTYDVEVSTHTYGQGQSHDGWGGDVIGTVDLILDVYEPTDAPAGRPAVIVIHGGGFTGGSRTNPNSEGFANYFAERGFVCINIDYRVAGDFGTVPQDWADLVQGIVPPDSQNQGFALYPAARDAKAAARWLNAQADTYQVDTDYVTSIGGSAGSYLAIVLGVTDPADFRDELDAAQDPTLETTNLDADAGVHTIIDHWGGISHMEILELLDGASRFDETDAPVNIVHGTADPTVLFEEAEKLRDAYMETGVPFAFHPLEGVGHGPWETIIDGMTLQELAFEFVLEQQALTVTE